MKHIIGTQGFCITLKADKKSLKWYVGVSFAAHSKFKSYTGEKLTIGGKSITSVSRKQKTEYENYHGIQVVSHE